MQVRSTFASMHDTAQRLRETIKFYMKRTGISATRLAKDAEIYSSFIPGFLNGRMARLDTADRLLTHMGMEPIGPRFRSEMAAYQKVTGANRCAAGQNALNDTAFLSRLTDGSAPELRTVDKLRAWMRRSTTAEEWQQIQAEASASHGAAASSGVDADALARGKPPPLMNSEELAAVLGVHERTVRRWRETGDGPKFHMVGRSVRYAWKKVDEWLASHERLSSSDPGEEPADTSPKAAPESTEEQQ